MRLRYLIPPLLLCVVAAGVVTAHAASDRQSSFSTAAQLRAQWDRDQAQGVPASSLAPLRSQAGQPAADGGVVVPGWLGDDGQTLLGRLQSETTAAWSAALDAQRTQAQALITQWNDFAQQQTSWLASDAVASAAQWSNQLGAATTPASIETLTTSWKGFLAQQRTAVVAAQQAKLAEALKSAGGPQAVLASARHLVAVAASANLDAGNVDPLATQLSNQIASGDNTDAITTGEHLLPAIASLQSLVNLNNQVSGQVLPLLWNVDQAEAEGTPKAAALAAQQAGIGAQFRAARTPDQLNAVAAAVTSLQSQIAAELAANQCGHPVGAGKQITISLAAGDGLLSGRLRRQGNPGDHRPAAAAHTHRPLLGVQQAHQLHVRLAVAEGIAVLLQPDAVPMGHGVRRRRLLHPRRLVGVDGLVRPGRPEQPAGGQPRLRPHPDAGDGVGVLLDPDRHAGGHQRLTSQRVRMFL